MKEDPWHDREEAFLTKIEQQCNDYAAHHSKDHMYYNKLVIKIQHSNFDHFIHQCTDCHITQFVPESGVRKYSERRLISWDWCPRLDSVVHEAQ